MRAMAQSLTPTDTVWQHRARQKINYLTLSCFCKYNHVINLNPSSSSPHWRILARTKPDLNIYMFVVFFSHNQLNAKEETQIMPVSFSVLPLKIQMVIICNRNKSNISYLSDYYGLNSSAMVRAISHGAMGCGINPSWQTH